MTIRDEAGDFIASRTLVSTGMMTVDEGEAWGVVEVLIWVKNLGFSHVIVELISSAVYDSPFGNYISEGKRLLS
ncbi:hypothetical protein ACS0TY_011702 [Phlomoides rotata]